MTDAEPPPAVEVEEAMPTTPDIALDSEGCQDVEAIKGEEDGGAPYGEVGKLGESLKPHGDGVVADEHMKIAEDPNLPDAKSDEPDEPEDADAKSDEPEDAGAEVQTDDVASAVDVLKEGVGVAVASSTLVDAPTEVGMQTNEDTAVDAFTDVGAALVTSTSMDDPTEMGSSLVIDDCNIVSTGGVHRPDDQPDKVAGADSLDADGDAPLVNDVQYESASTDKDVAVSDDVAQGHETPLMDVSTALLNEVDTETAKARDHVAEDTNMDTQVQTGNDNEAEGVSTIAAMTRDNSEKHNGVGIDAFGQGIETERDVLTGDDEQKEIAAADEDHVEEEGVHMDALNITGDMDKEGRIVVDNIADEAVDGMAVPEEKSAQMDEAGDDTPEEEDAQMGGVGLTGNDNEQEEAVVADHDGLEENAMLIDAAATTNDDDEDDGIVGEDVAEAATGTVGDDAPEENATPIDSDDDDDEPPPLVARKGGRHRKRGRPSSKAQAAVKVSIKKKDEEEVCFICFDGGDLVICDRRGCPKAYHPSCVNRDDDFFRSKGRWNCGMYDTFDVDFDDKSSWWYLFKDYWLNLKTNLSLTVEEISAAKSQKSRDLPDTNDEEAISESSSGRHLENNTPKKRGRKRLKEAAIEDGSEGKESTRKSTKPGLSSIRDAQTSPGKKVRKLSRRCLSSQHSSKESESIGTSTSSAEEANWASEELLNFVAHMRNGDKSFISQFDVQPLLLDYIKRNNLRDPRRTSQIICDSLLQSLFGKKRVGHFEMLKLLESHFATSEVSPSADENHGGVVDPDPSQDADGNSEASVVMSSEKRRKSRKYDQKRQPNLDDYAAIDNHNIGLMYLRRNLMEELIGDVETFEEKVVGSFVRIRIPGTGQRQDIYRLVQIVGKWTCFLRTCLAWWGLRGIKYFTILNDPFQSPWREYYPQNALFGIICFVCTILNFLLLFLGTGKAAEKYKSGKKTTDITLEILNLDKREAVTIDIISNQEFTELFFSFPFVNYCLPGRGSGEGKGSPNFEIFTLRECVEKLKLLSTPEERARRLNEEPEIHADPAMDPDYESPEEQEQETERNSFNKSRGSFLRKDGNLVSPVKGDGRTSLQRDPKSNWESNRNTWAESSSHMESPLSRRSTFSPQGESAGYANKSDSPNIGAQTVKLEGTTHSTSQGPSGVPSGILAANVAPGAKTASQPAINESEKIWQYMDPSNKIQGPFSIIQLRKWNSNGYFPPSLKIWKASEKQDDSILLTDALAGKFEKDLPPWEPPHVSSSQIGKTPLHEEGTITGEQTPKSGVPKSFSSSNQTQDYSSTNLGATMIHSGTQGYYGMQNSHVAHTNQQSLTGSWNAASSQFGVAVNPMTPTQPAMGSFTGQNIVAAGNMGHLTPGMAPAAAELTSDLPSQNQISSALPQIHDRLADGSESKLADASGSHGRVSSSGEGRLFKKASLLQLDSFTAHFDPVSYPQNCETGAKFMVLLSLNVSQPNSIVVVSPADTRHQMSTPSAAQVQPVVTAIAGSDTQSSGWAISAQGANTSVQSQVAGNMTWGPAPQGDASMGWGMMGQSNMNMPWVASAQGASGYNMGVTMPTQPPSAVPSVGWVPNPGNTSMNMIWAATQGQGTPNAAAMMGGQMQGVAMANWGGVAAGNANTYPGWGTQQIGNMNQHVSWSAPVQGTPGQANNNMNWNASNGNPDWNNQQRDNGGRHSGHRDLGGRWKSRSGGDGGSRGHRPPGVCWSYVNSGHCWKVDCRYTHPPNTDGYSSRNDRQFDRQHSGNERRFDNHNERNDGQFDRQPPDSERPDDRHNSRDDDRHDDQQADRSQSREPR
ncbi:hypothetical protein HU200_012096 [Digitaria exilis]|uniref:Zinc finger CCCH domain-containing protein 19 n=1 Tax=Digitaria exilis TaxID=1010633 RepID=A0A835KNJ8_9POAL|nr:hypothetical protein HU200_012096 [Digitaria exilis]